MNNVTAATSPYNALVDAVLSGQDPVPTTEARDELVRELQVRKRCYPGWVSDGRMSQTDATDRVRRLAQAVGCLNELIRCESATDPQVGPDAGTLAR